MPMPVNHGLYQRISKDKKKGDILTTDDVPVFRYGILGLFEALRSGPFLGNPADKMKAAQLQQHFTEVCRRFVFSLQSLNGLMQQMADAYSQEPPSPQLMELDFEAGCHADHVFSYLGTLVDDIAILIVRATGATGKKDIDSMGVLKHPNVRKQPALAPVQPPLVALDNPGSWWELAFKTLQGVRQLLIHNQHLVTFHASCPPGGPFEAKAALMTPSAHNPIAGDFFEILRETLLKLFDWLDGLERALVLHLQSKVAAWSPPLKCPFFLLSVGFPQSGVYYHPNYFPIPLCNGSDPLPWVISGPIGP
jgi:hypothetical protein